MEDRMSNTNQYLHLNFILTNIGSKSIKKKKTFYLRS